MCQAVLDTIKTLEEGTSSTVMRNNYNDLNSLEGRMFLIDKTYSSLTGNKWYKHPSVWEFGYWSLRVFALLSMLIVAVILFYDVI
jgi:hypothetical protein